MRRPRKVQLLGCGFTRGVVPPLDPEGERWGLNKLMFLRYGGEFEGWDRWFDLHATAQIQARRPDAYTWYTRQIKPVYRFVDDPELPSCEVYPREAVQRFFQGDTRFWGSLSWMLALAIYEGFQVIELFWFTMDDSEHAAQVPSALYWIGQARGRGITVTIHGDSPLNPSGPLYGLET